MGKLIDITGKRYGRLVALRHTRQNKHRQSVWLCRCDCGTQKEVTSNQLRTGAVRSCGCLLDEVLHEIHRTHGGAYHPLYQTWCNIKQRCSNPNHKDYPRYGGRGIVMCDRWANDFGAFLEDIGERPDGSYSLDRIDGDKDYEPENVRWATPEEQARNKDNVISLSLNGETKLLVEWADDLNLTAGLLRSRYSKGWTDEQILTTPVTSPQSRERDEQGKWVTVLDSELDERPSNH